MLYSDTDLKNQLSAAVSGFQERIKKLRVGRASADTFELIKVEAYGMPMELRTLASIAVDGPTSVLITPRDKSLLQSIYDSLELSGLTYNFVKEADKVRVNIPAMTEEVRKDTVKKLGAMLEEGKVSVRHIRRTFMDELEKLESVSEDDVKRDKEQIQKQVDSTIESLDNLAKLKEKELLTIN